MSGQKGSEGGRKRKPRLAPEDLFALLAAAEGWQQSLIASQRDTDPEQTAKERRLLKIIRDFRLAHFGESGLERAFTTAGRVSIYDIIDRKPTP